MNAVPRGAPLPPAIRRQRQSPLVGWSYSCGAEQERTIQYAHSVPRCLRVVGNKWMRSSWKSECPCSRAVCANVSRWPSGRGTEPTGSRTVPLKRERGLFRLVSVMFLHRPRGTGSVGWDELDSITQETKEEKMRSKRGEHEQKRDKEEEVNVSGRRGVM